MFLGQYIEKNYYTIVTEEMNENLLDLLEDFSIHLSTKKKLDIAIEIVKGFVYLHSLDMVILHWDLKAENILLNNNN